MTRNLTLVFGNLGRNPNILLEHLQKYYSNLEIVIISPHYHFPESHNIHVNVPVTQCDLLIYLEPSFQTFIQKPNFVHRVVVFSSHLFIENIKDLALVSYFEFSDTDIMYCEKLLEIQDNSLQDRNISLLKTQIDHHNVKTIAQNMNANYIISPNKPYPEIEFSSYIIVDLTHCQKTIESFLSLLDIFDVLKKFGDRIDGWRICYPEYQMDKMERLIQSYLDRLFCTNIQVGNVIDKVKILSLTPFYKPGVYMNNLINTEITRFGNKTIYIPKTNLEAFALNSVKNLKSINHRMYLENDD